MRYALISDIHANEPALRAVLADIAGRPGIAATYHLGDLVGYAPFPDETVALLRAAGIAGGAGNSASAPAADSQHCGCRYEDPHQEELAHQSYEWTRAHVSPETKRFLGGLPFRIDLRPLGGHVVGPTVTLIHGNQLLNTVYVFEERPDEFLSKMAGALGARPGETICFGHTHKPWHREAGGIHFVNTGSVGKPKDGDWRAGYVALDGTPARRAADFIRVEYAVESIARTILASELPNEFAEQLRTGGKPAAPALSAPP